MKKISELGSRGLGSYRRFKVWFFWKMMNNSFLLGETAVWIEFFEKIFFQNVLHKIAHRMIVTEFSIWTWVVRRLSPKLGKFHRNWTEPNIPNLHIKRKLTPRRIQISTKNDPKSVQNGPKWPKMANKSQNQILKEPY